MSEKKVSEADRLSIDVMLLQKKLAEVLAEKSAVEAQLADFKYKNHVLQVYVKYGLTLTDTIDEKGCVSSNEEAK